MGSMEQGKTEIPRFERDFWRSSRVFARIGDGELGGKAKGLVFAQEVLEARVLPQTVPNLEVAIPRSIVLTTEIFDLFLEQNELRKIADAGSSDERIAHAFQKGEMPVEVVGDLRTLIEGVHTPLAVRSSSRLEDALFRPFAGVYATKMTPNNQPDGTTRFRKLVEAIKLVWASAFFGEARDYLRAIERSLEDEKMAVVIQEVVGNRRGASFYPEVSGVARSYNFYPHGDVAPDEGVVNLALGLGKTIVDGDVSWTYVPTRPNAPPPFGSVRDMLHGTQLQYWAVHMGPPPEFDPTKETEYLGRYDLAAADYDGALDRIVSTYEPQSERLFPGTGRTGPRVLTFAPLLEEETAFNETLQRLMVSCMETMGAPVEIEFALRLPCPGGPTVPQFYVLQVRPMVVSKEPVTIEAREFEAPALRVRSSRAMGNGVIQNIRDIIYVCPESFTSLKTRGIAAELGQFNRRLLEEGRPYLLIGFGRWGSADGALGIPVQWSQISGAKVIVEATLPEMNVEPSQGSHFFHNITSFAVSYLHVHHDDPDGVDWSWLQGQTCVGESEHVRHVRLEAPLLVKVDGRSGRGGVWSRGEQK